MTTTFDAPAERSDAQPSPIETRPGPMPRGEQVAFCVFATWSVIGLFVDGWAHQAEKPETFFTPWHGVLYSGFLGGLLAAAVGTARDRYLGRPPQAPVVGARLTRLGALLFLAGGVGDMVWHLSFGVEVDTEALLSPTHLMLAAGGLLAVSAPLRAAWATDLDDRPGWAAFAPVLLGTTLGVAIVSFFTMILSAFHLEGLRVAWTPDSGTDLLLLWGIASVLLTNLLLAMPVVLLMRRWHLPFGAITASTTAIAVLMEALVGFESAERVVPAAAAGLMADLVARRTDAGPSNRRGALLGAIALSFVLWPAFFATTAATTGLGWSAELWTGTVVLAVATTFAVHLMTTPLPNPVPEALAEASK